MYKVTKTIAGLLFFCCCSTVSAQAVQKIGDQAFTLNNSAVFELQSTTKGFLAPRMTTTQRNDIYKPAKGLIIFNVSVNELEVNAGTLDTPIWVGTTIANPAITAVRLTDDYTILSSDSTVLFDATTKNLTATLPDATLYSGKIFYVRKDDTTNKTLTISPQVKAQGTLITLSLNYPKTIKVQSDGTNWVVID